MKNNGRMLGVISLVFICGISLAVDPNSVPGPKTEVRQSNGRAVFFMDGKPFTEPLFATYHPYVNYFKEMSEQAGFKLFNFNFASASFDGYGGSWEDPNKFDFTTLDERAHNVLKANPNAMMMPRIFIGTPNWWLKKYPQELCVLDTGKTVFDQPCNPFGNVWLRPYPSMASKQWRQDMAFALRKTIQHIQASDYAKNIFGYELGGLGSEEWYYMQVNQEQVADYSKPMQEAFREWLKKKYASDIKLAEAWGKKGLTFDKVTIPTREERQCDRANTFRDPTARMNVIDYDMFYNIALADTIDYLAGVVKEESGHKKIVGPYCNYSLEFDNPGFGHLGGQYMMSKSENIDMLINSPTWFDRQMGVGADYSRRPNQSGMLNNKVCFNDFDGASWLFPKVTKDWDRKTWTAEKLKELAGLQAVTPTAQETIWMFQRAAGFSLCTNLYQSFFDLHSGYYSHPRLFEAVSAMREMLAKSANYDCHSVSQILALFDEPSQTYQTYESDWEPNGKPSIKLSAAGLRFQAAFVKSGAPFDIIYMADLDKANLDQYKIFFFVNAWNIDDNLRKLIKDKLMQKGKTVIWCYAPGYFNGTKASAQLMRDITGINIVPSTDETLISPLMRLNQAGRKFLSDANEPNDLKPFGMAEKVCKLFEVKDPDAQALATLPDSNAVAIAEKNVNGATVFYMLNSVLTPEMVRAIGKNAGVHFYNRAGDDFYANKSYMSIHAANVGDRTIKLPAKFDVYDAMTEHKLFHDVNEFDDSFMFGQTRTYRIEKLQ